MVLPHEVLECLIGSRHLGLRDLLNLRATSKLFHARLTGALPDYVMYEVFAGADDPQTVSVITCSIGDRDRIFSMMPLSCCCVCDLSHRSLHGDCSWRSTHSGLREDCTIKLPVRRRH